MPTIKIKVSHELLQVLENVDLYDVAESIGWTDEDPRFEDFIKMRNDVYLAMGDYDHVYEKIALSLSLQGYSAEYLAEFGEKKVDAIVTDAPAMVVMREFGALELDEPQVPLNMTKVDEGKKAYYR